MSSQVIDEKVVEMRFQNSQFEKGVKESMSTIDKLKASLNFSGASKSFNQITEAANRVSFKGLERNVDELHNYINLKAVAMFTVVNNMVSQIQSSITNMVKQFTIVPISTGFQEYELKMGSVQTIMAATGESLETVNKYLQELNEYSDKTIYSFSDMTQNIGKFTNAGVKLEDAVLAMKGISNEAAISGANANEASRAMYNLAQSLSMGYVQYIDWKSIENANMATVAFKENLANVATQLGIITKTSDGYYDVAGKSYNLQQLFKDALKEQWLTTDVLITTLRDYADETTEIGKKAYAAAQDVKTFTMMMDTLKEAAQSGWAYTWEIFIGDFNEAKQMFTEFSQMFGKMIDDSSEARNSLLRGVLGSKWDRLISYINAAGIATEEFEGRLTRVLRDAGLPVDEMVKKWGSLEEAIRHMGDVKDYVIKVIQSFTAPIVDTGEAVGAVTGKLEDFQKVVNQVIRGEFGSGADRVKRLSAAGWEYAQVQGLVNKVWEKNNHTWKDTTITIDDLVEVLGKMSTEELEQVGITEEQVRIFQELQEQAALTGSDLNKLIENLYKPTGRELIFDTIRNAVNALVQRFQIVKQAWLEVFPQKGTEELYGILEAINKFSKVLILNEDKADKLRRTFRGIFSALGLVTDVIQAMLKVLFPGLLEGVDLLHGGLLDVGAVVGDVIYGFREFIKADGILVNAIQDAVDTVKQWIKEFSKLPVVVSVIEKIKNAIKSLVETCKNLLSDLRQEIEQDIDENGFRKAASVLEMLKKLIEKIGDKLNDIAKTLPFINDVKNAFSEMFAIFKSDGENVVAGFIDGITLGMKELPEKMIEFSKLVVDTVKDFLGIHSPALTFVHIALQCCQGLALGFRLYTKLGIEKIKELGKLMLTTIQGFVDKIKTFLLNNKAIEEFKNNVKKGTDGITEWLKNFVNTIGSFVKKLHDYVVENHLADSILDLVKIILSVLLLFNTVKMVHNIGSAATKIGDAFEAISGGFSGFFKSLKNVGRSAIIRNFAISVAVVLGVIAYISKTLSDEDVNRAWEVVAMANDIIIVLGGMLAILIVIQNYTSQFALNTGGLYKMISSIALLIISVAASVWLLFNAFATFEGLKPDTLKGAVDIIRELLMALFTMSVTLSLIGVLGKGSIFGVAFSLLAIAIGVRMIIDIINKYFYTKKDGVLSFNNTKAAELMEGFSSLFWIIATLAGSLAAIAIASRGGSRIAGVGAAVLGMALSLHIIILAIKFIDETLKTLNNPAASIGGIIVIFVALTVAMGVLEVAARGVRPAALFQAAALVLAFAGAVWIITKAINNMEYVYLDFGSVAVLFTLIGVLAVVAIVVAALDNFKKPQLVGARSNLIGIAALLLAMTASLWIITKMLSDYDLDRVLKATIILGSIMLALGLVLFGAGSLSKAGIGSALTIFAVASALGVLAASIYFLQDVDAEKIVTIAVALGGVMAVLEWATSFIAGGWQVALVVIAIAGALWLVGETIKNMSDLPFDKLVTGMINLLGVIVVISVAMFAFLAIASLFAPILLPAAAVIAAVALAILAIAVAIGIVMEYKDEIADFIKGIGDKIKGLIDKLKELAKQFQDSMDDIFGEDWGEMLGNPNRVRASGITKETMEINGEKTTVYRTYGQPGGHRKGSKKDQELTYTEGSGTETTRYGGPNQLEVHTLTQQSAEAGKKANEAMTNELAKPIPADKAEDYIQSYTEPFLESADGTANSWLTYMKDSFGKFTQGTKIDPSDWSSFLNIEGVEYDENTKKMIGMLSSGMKNADWSTMTEAFSTYLDDPEMAKMFSESGMDFGTLFGASFNNALQEELQKGLSKEEVEQNWGWMEENAFKLGNPAFGVKIPVIDKLQTASAASTMGNNMTGLLGNMAAGGFNAVQFPETMNTTSPDVVNAVNALHQDIQTLYVKIANLQVRLDTGALVGNLTPQINQSMGKMAVYKVRGN